ILAAYGITREITPRGHPLRWLLPLSLALLPGFVDIMSAVNDDVGATAAFSLFLWVGVRIIQRGFSWMRLLALAVTTAACAFTKNTVVVAIVLASLPVLVRLFRNVRRRYLWAGIVVSLIFLSFSVLRYEDAAAWHRNTNQQSPTKTTQYEAPVGRNSFQFDSSKGVFQIIPLVDAQELSGKKVTLGAWMWADNPTQLRTPSLRFQSMDLYQTVEVNSEPSFHAFTATLPTDLARLQVTVFPGIEPEQGSRVFYDGITLVEGDFINSGVPKFNDPNASQLVWSGFTLKNYIRNASAERSWFSIRPMVERILEKYVPGSPDLYFSLLQDWRSATWYYQVTSENLLQTFWGKFGWGHVPLKGKITYPILALISVIGFVGAGISLIRHWRTIPLNAYLFLFFSGAVIWLFTILRGLASIMAILFIPSSRYAYPAIIPTMLALNMGWLEIGKLILGKRYSWLLGYILVVSWVSMDILAVVSIMRYYR
ncbi:MAG: hypothetical protein ACWGO1_15320, partial [Anaerolineales bacterium]